MSYVDGYVLAVPEKNMKVYKKMAKEAGEMWVRHGALNYVEALGDDLESSEWCKLPFTKLMKTKPGEVVIFAFVTYKNKAHRNQVNKRVMKECKTIEHPTEMPFDMKRMAFGGFKSFVDVS